MRVMLLVTYPTAKFNELWRAGEAGPKIRKILEDTKPEAAYFGRGAGGRRGAVIIVNVATEADLPRVTEPWYLTLEAEVEVSIVMTPEEIGKLDYAGLAEKYG